MHEVLVLEHGVKIIFWTEEQRMGVMVEDQEGCSQFPIMYTPRGKIAYDFPERISQEQKEEVRRAFNMICPEYWSTEEDPDRAKERGWHDA